MANTRKWTTPRVVTLVCSTPWTPSIGFLEEGGDRQGRGVCVCAGVVVAVATGLSGGQLIRPCTTDHDLSALYCLLPSHCQPSITLFFFLIFSLSGWTEGGEGYPPNSLLPSFYLHVCSYNSSSIIKS
uniref:Uncharacterized protein n=1 Tax=Ditylenchus dipsaci TaxID=166011 RepID=A0A915D4H5_9BILA